VSYVGPQGTCGGAWFDLDDSDRISYRIGPGIEAAGFVDFSFIGQVELALSMSESTLRRCRDLFTEALAELSAQSTELTGAG
jgi:hypothetical protein